NLNYLFGLKEVLTQIDYTIAGAAPYGSYISDRYLIRDLNFNFGLQYFRRVSKDLTLGFGATYSPQTALKTYRDFFAGSFTSSANAFAIVDTIQSVSDTGNSILASKIGLGFSIEIGSSYTLLFDYKLASRQNETLIGAPLNQ